MHNQKAFDDLKKEWTQEFKPSCDILIGGFGSFLMAYQDNLKFKAKSALAFVN